MAGNGPGTPGGGINVKGTPQKLVLVAVVLLVGVVAFAALLRGPRDGEQVPEGLLETLWKGPATAFAGEPRSLSVLPGDGVLVAATSEGLYASHDDGASWLDVDVLGGSVNDVLVHPERPEVGYAAGPGLGVVKTSDGGATWSPAMEGLSSDQVQALAMHTDNHDTLYASIGTQIFETRDGGQSWWEPVEGPVNPPRAIDHSTLEGSMNTGWLYAATDSGPYLSMD